MCQATRHKRQGGEYDGYVELREDTIEREITNVR